MRCVSMSANLLVHAVHMAMTPIPMASILVVLRQLVYGLLFFSTLLLVILITAWLVSKGSVILRQVLDSRVLVVLHNLCFSFSVDICM